MNRRSFIARIVAGLAAFETPARAQRSGALPVIGYLNNLNPAVAAPSTQAFLRGLADLGWIEGKTIAVEYRWADGDMGRHPALVAELVKLPVAVIVTAGTYAVRAAQQATKTIPIVVAIMPDPVALGFVETLARPGGNTTGLANLFEDLTPKQLQIFQEAMPHARRIALFSDRGMGDDIEKTTEAAARTLGLVTRTFAIVEPGDLDIAFRAAKADRMDAVLVLPSPFLNRYRARIATLAAAQKLPTFSEASEYVRDGGLASYGPSFPQMYYRAATYVDRILKGEKPGDLPIERPTKFELVISLRTAKAIGMSVPQSLLLRADEIVR